MAEPSKKLEKLDKLIETIKKNIDGSKVEKETLRNFIKMPFGPYTVCMNKDKKNNYLFTIIPDGTTKDIFQIDTNSTKFTNCGPFKDYSHKLEALYDTMIQAIKDYNSIEKPRKEINENAGRILEDFLGS